MDTHVSTGQRHVWTQTVSLSGIDWNGHVNNVRMSAWVQDSWTHLLAPGEGAPPTFAAATHHAQYQKPLPYRSRVRIETSVSELLRCTVTGTAAATDGATDYARITTTWVAFDTAAQRARALTDTERVNLTRP
ncbi:acyl-CoA thioesterase [Streptomyces sp. H27-D2]|uniref:acyl-CoA thioesterase n=1 Tax=Streptomyces sp. H27-D2 TaxID=3046304 RepID=UPI002DBB9DA8|nr:thioesterase family protein [Streptomyces sp. H27-D2]MEC4020848.1 thioesterase family protein [Streptomyces sp. H27-D2]